MEKVQWKVEGMTCANCALTIHKFLEKEGMREVKVNALGGDVSFEMNGNHTQEDLARGIKGLGYRVVGAVAKTGKKLNFLHTSLQRFWFCFPFTVLIMLPMIPWVKMPFLMNPGVQLSLCIPVYIVGMSFFGKSAIKSLRNGMPNMNVLVAMGATAAFVYSVYGIVIHQAMHYLFFETASAILTIVFLGNYLEDISLQSTQRALNALASSQKVMANMIAYDNQHQEHIFPVENTQLKPGDLVLIRSGEQVPMDCKILWGEAFINESIITGESLPVHKQAKDKLIGGSMLQDGTIKAQVTAIGNETILSGIINLVKRAQGDKPPVQQLADKISAVFVPAVIAIAGVTFVISWMVLGDFTPSLMRSIAVLVIACPCAMGLATPAAIAVGLGRGARNGILFRNATSLELFKDIRQVVFDKTGTLTTGALTISHYQIMVLSAVDHDHQFTEPLDSDPDLDFRKLVYSLEKYSNHPIARAITKQWKTKSEMKWSKVEEIKGVGIKAIDTNNNQYTIGSFRVAEHVTGDHTHDAYIIRNERLIGWIDLKDELRAEAKSVVAYLRARGIRTFLLSGDRLSKCQQIADELSIDEVIAEQSPEQKLQKIDELNKLLPTVMIGDGINDAPALAKATIGISLSEASQIALQTAQVVLMGSGLKNLPAALGLGRQTYVTIKQNLFWAFIYNIIAIPVAALGFLTPTIGALVMGLSDVVLALNSVRLFVKKIV